jgi:hypothetical protein
MGHCFWKPMDQAGDFERGLLAELWRNQPPQPLVQRVDHRFTFLARMGQIYVWHELEKIFADMPIEVILAAGKELDKMHSQADDAIRLFMQLKGQGRHKQGFRAWQYLDAGEATLVNHYGQRINPDDDPEVWMEAFWELYRPWEYAWRCGQVDKETWFVRAIRANPRLRNHPDKIMDLATTAMIGGANPRFIEGAIELLIEAGDFGKGVKLSDFWMEKGKTEQEEALDTAWGTTTHGFVGGDEPAKLVEGGQMMQAVCTRGR